MDINDYFHKIEEKAEILLNTEYSTLDLICVAWLIQLVILTVYTVVDQLR